MTEAEVDEVVRRSGAGEGVEAALKVMGLNISISLEDMKSHPSAKGRIKDAKVQLAIARRAVQAEVQP